MTAAIPNRKRKKQAGHRNPEKKWIMAAVRVIFGQSNKAVTWRSTALLILMFAFY